MILVKGTHARNGECLTRFRFRAPLPLKIVALRCRERRGCQMLSLKRCAAKGEAPGRPVPTALDVAPIKPGGASPVEGGRVVP